MGSDSDASQETGTPRSASTPLKRLRGAASTGRKTGTPEVEKSREPKPKPRELTPTKPLPIVLEKSELRLLKRVAEAVGAGFLPTRKVDHSSLESLLQHRLVKRGAKDRLSGIYHFRTTKAGTSTLLETTKV